MKVECSHDSSIAEVSSLISKRIEIEPEELLKIALGVAVSGVSLLVAFVWADGETDEEVES